MTRLSFLPLVLFFTTGISASTLTISPETPVTPGTVARMTDGTGSSVATLGDGTYMAAWINSRSAAMTTPIDANGRVLGDAVPQLSGVYSAAIVALDDTYVVLGSSMNGIYARITGHTAQQKIHDGYVNWMTAASNGHSLLLLMVTQSGNTETLHATLFDASLHVIKDSIALGTRDLGAPFLGHAVLPHVASDGDDFLVVWETIDPNTRLTLTPVSRDGEVGASAMIDVGTPALQPTIAFTSSGYRVAWHDGKSVYAMHVNADGTAAGAPSSIGSVSAPIVSVSAGGDAIAWTERISIQCDWLDITTAHVQNGTGDTETIEGVVGDVWLAGDLAVFDGQSCSSERSALSQPLLSHGPPHIISSHLSSSQQQSPAAASDGVNAVAVWIERRGDAPPQVFAALVDGRHEGIAISDGDAAPSRPRIAFDGVRYVATWTERSAVIMGRFLARDGTPDGNAFRIGPGSEADVAWDGFEFVVAWPAGGTITAARVTTNGEVTSAGSTEAFKTTSHVFIAGGPGEAVVEFAATTNDEWRVVTALIPRSGPIAITGTLASASQKCLGMPKGCQYGAEPIGIAWNGATYLAESLIQNHPAYGYSISASTLSIGGFPTTATRRVRSGGIGGESTASAGPIVWMGNEFVSVIPTAFGSMWLQQLGADGTPLDGMGANVGATDSVPAAVRLSGNRMLLVYSHGRMSMRTIDVTTPPKQRSARH